MKISEYHAHGSFIVSIPIDINLAAHSAEEMRDIVKYIFLNIARGKLIEDQVSIVQIKELINREDKK